MKQAPALYSIVIIPPFGMFNILPLDDQIAEVCRHRFHFPVEQVLFHFHFSALTGQGRHLGNKKREPVIPPGE